MYKIYKYTFTDDDGKTYNMKKPITDKMCKDDKRQYAATCFEAMIKAYTGITHTIEARNVQEVET